MFFEAHDILGRYLVYFTTKIINDPLGLLWYFFDPLTFSLIFLMLFFKLFRSLFFVVGILISHMVLFSVVYFALLSFVITTAIHVSVYLFGLAVFCLVCAYLCLKNFVNYFPSSSNVVSRYDNIKILLFGAFYTVCNIGFLFDDVKMMTTFVNPTSFSEVVTGYYFTFFYNLIPIAISSLFAAIIYLLIKMMPFKNMTRIGFLGLGICFIVYLPVYILFSGPF